MGFDLIQCILDLRPDLREDLQFGSRENAVRFLFWLLTSGQKEYAALRDNPQQVQAWLATTVDAPVGLSPLAYALWQGRPDLQAAFPLPESRAELHQWLLNDGLREYQLAPLFSPDEHALLMHFSGAEGDAMRAVVVQQLAAEPVPRVISFGQRPFGVNVVGYASRASGIGEDARQAAGALQSVGVPISIVDIAPESAVGDNAESEASVTISSWGDYAVNLFCMTAEDQSRVYLERGAVPFMGRYNIGYWPWELSKWPQAWLPVLELMDEVWVSSRHTYSALADVCTKPLRWMPIAVALGEVLAFPSRAVAREHFGLPLGKTLFCFAFDLKSYSARKNPEACVEAFLRAFPRGSENADRVGLVIKVQMPEHADPAWSALKAWVRADARIQLIESTLPKPELLALYASCDCFLSLHRAEGFGRNLVEALQLGLHVICTGYSGNVDFCAPPYADGVDYTLIPVESGQYPYSADQVWANPDVDHAAKLMRNFVAQRGDFPVKTDWPEFSAKTIGLAYLRRLEEIRQSLASEDAQTRLVWSGGSHCAI